MFKKYDKYAVTENFFSDRFFNANLTKNFIIENMGFFICRGDHWSPAEIMVKP